MAIRMIFFFAIVIFVSGCGVVQENDYNPTTIAVATLHEVSESGVKGVVLFIKELEGVRVVGNIEGLRPGFHGFHIHEFGDCSAMDASSVGDYFNPYGSLHKDRTFEERHVGDFGNIEAGEAGIAEFEFIDPVIDFYGYDSVIGRALIVYEKKDDFKLEPIKNAGERIACGIIGISKED